MSGTIKLGRVLGIPIGLDVSWFLVFALVTWSLAAAYFPGEYPGLPTAAYWALGAVTSLFFFGSVLLHELGHALIAIRNRVPVLRITLFIFGGIAQIARDARTPGAEFRIAIAGPIVSLGLAALFWLVWLGAQAVPYLAVPSLWLARINLMLALFNMIPGFPLDGGRVLRALLWQGTGDFMRATVVATTIGQFIAFGFIGLGIFLVLQDNFFDGLWIIFIGWFLQNAASASYAQANLQHALQGVTVEQVMLRDCPRVSGHVPLNRMVEDQILTGGQRCFFVADDGQLRGVLTLRDIAAVPRANWGSTTAGEVMVPLDRLARVQPNTELLTALAVMDDADVAQVPVLQGEQIVGMLSREQVLHYVRLRAELGI